MRRGDVYQADLSPVQGSEQAGTRPVIIVSRDAINDNSPVVIIVPITGAENKRKIYPTHILLPAGEGGSDERLHCHRRTSTRYRQDPLTIEYRTIET